MKIDLGRIILRPLESEAFYLQTKWRDSFMEDIGGKFITPVEVEIIVENTGTRLGGSGNVRTMLQLPCSRCLKDFIYPIDTEIAITMAESTHSNQSIDEDDGMVFIEGGKVDISSMVEEAIFMAIAISPLCGEECQGLCPICGQDRNTATCFCEKDTIDPRWEKLKSLT
jgi:uncharacterized protein